MRLNVDHRRIFGWSIVMMIGIKKGIGTCAAIAVCAGIATSFSTAVIAGDEILDKARAFGSMEKQFDKLTNSVTLGGYYDFEYQDDQRVRTSAGERNGGGDGEGDFDQHRFVLFVGAKPHERIRFFSELEFEHGAKSTDLKLEQAWLEYGINRYLNLRGGVDLIPVGRLNINHDANLQDFIFRPAVDEQVIPSTWYEAGVSLSGAITDQVNYIVGMSNGLRDARTNSATSVGEYSEFRNMRRTNALSEDDNNNAKSVHGRIAVSPWLGTEFGISGYQGRYSNTDPGLNSVGTANTDSDITYLAFDWYIPWRAFEFKGEYVNVNKDVERGSQIEGASGAYGELAWHFFPEFLRETFFGRDFDDPKFTLLGRVENLDFDTFGNDDLLDRNYYTVGLNYRPIENMAVKLSYDWEDRKEQGAPNSNRFGAGMVLGF